MARVHTQSTLRRAYLHRPANYRREAKDHRAYHRRQSGQRSAEPSHPQRAVGRSRTQRHILECGGVEGEEEADGPTDKEAGAHLSEADGFQGLGRVEPVDPPEAVDVDAAQEALRPLGGRLGGEVEVARGECADVNRPVSVKSEESEGLQRDADGECGAEEARIDGADGDDGGEEVHGKIQQVEDRAEEKVVDGPFEATIEQVAIANRTFRIAASLANRPVGPRG